jgi:hypothetical protein
VKRKLRNSIPLLLTVSFAACLGERKEGANMIAGEWAIQLSDRIPSSNHREVAAALARGVVVLHPEIECYCGGDSPPPHGAIFGRGYVALGRLLNPTAPREQPTFSSPDWGGDMGEEVIATTGPKGRVNLVLAPQFSGPHFTGILHGDSITGQWIARGSGNTQPSGTFLMRRLSRSFYTDSALRRSSRGIERWRTAVPPPLTAPADTAHPVESPK